MYTYMNRSVSTNWIVNVPKVKLLFEKKVLSCTDNAVNRTVHMQVHWNEKLCCNGLVP